jgi:hypothetical protein
MLTLEINLNDAGAKSGIAAILAALEQPEKLHKAMAAQVEDGVRTHLQQLNARSPNTNFYAQAAASVEHTSAAAGAVVRVPHRGMALRFHGGTVTAGASISSFTGQTTKSLAVPTDDVPVRDGRRLAPREAGILAFIPNRGGDIHTSGFLVEGVEKEITRGKNKGQKRAVPKEGGALLYILRRLTLHDDDPTVLPGLDVLIGLAGEGAAEFINSQSSIS